MPSIHETAYPRLKASVSAKDLAEVYTPTCDEMKLAEVVGRGFTSRICFLIVLKTFQRLGYFVPLAEVPAQIIRHITRCSGGLPIELDTAAYDDSGTRRRHVAAIRRHMNVSRFGEEARCILAKAVREVSKTKNDLADIVNVGIEELIRHRFELPVFETIHSEAKRARSEVNKVIFNEVAQGIGETNERTGQAFF